MASRVACLPVRSWGGFVTPSLQLEAVSILESGRVLLLPDLAFPVSEEERVLLTPRSLPPGAKNVVYDPAGKRLRHASVAALERPLLAGMMERFSDAALELLRAVAPRYGTHLEKARTSFRPADVAQSRFSYRKDDTRLHVDAFPSDPVKGKRILRVFSNIDPQGHDRVWRLGAPFAEVAAQFLPSLRKPLPGELLLVHLLRIARRERSPYDHYMLGLHNSMKRDLGYQKRVAQEEVRFPAGSSWIVFTDAASHAAMEGQNALEQTFYCPIEAMADPSLAPLRVLEERLGSRLA